MFALIIVMVYCHELTLSQLTTYLNRSELLSTMSSLNLPTTPLFIAANNLADNLESLHEVHEQLATAAVTDVKLQSILTGVMSDIELLSELSYTHGFENLIASNPRFLHEELTDITNRLAYIRRRYLELRGSLPLE